MKRGKILFSNAERGQSFVELGASIVFLLILFAVLIDLGWAFFNLISLRDGAQEAASFASICPGETGQIKSRAIEAMNDTIDTGDPARFQVNVCVVGPSGDCSGTPEIGGQIRVTVQYEHEIMAPFLGALNGSQSYPLKVTANDTILQTWCQAANPLD